MCVCVCTRAAPKNQLRNDLSPWPFHVGYFSITAHEYLFNSNRRDVSSIPLWLTVHFADSAVVVVAILSPSAPQTSGSTTSRVCARTPQSKRNGKANSYSLPELVQRTCPISAWDQTDVASCLRSFGLRHESCSRAGRVCVCVCVCVCQCVCVCVCVCVSVCVCVLSLIHI